MSDFGDTPDPHPGESCDRQWLASALLTTPGALARVQQEYHAFGGSADGALAARRALDAVLLNAAGWPRDDDYLYLADVFATDRGDLDMAGLLRDAAAAGELMADAADRWMLRYADRTRLPHQNVATWLSRGYIDFDPRGPYRGVDGAEYQPGYTTNGLLEKPVVVVTTRAMREVITEWRDYEEMRRWVASRGSTGSGDLESPPAAEESRLIREERVLARLLTHHSNVREVATVLPAVTFTCDLRYDLYQAIIATARQDPAMPDSLLRREFARRLAWVPGTAIAAYGGPDGGIADLYRSRLTDTTVAKDDALNAAWSLRDEDRHAVRARAYLDLAAQTAGPWPAPPEHRPVAAPVQRPPSPDPGSGPAPRM
jgi:hypothetical protein